MGNADHAMDQLFEAIRNVAQKADPLKLQPENELFFQWKLSDFVYSDKGVENAAAQSNYLEKKTWVRARIFLQEKIATLPEIDHVKLKLREDFPGLSDDIYDRVIDRITNQGVSCCLERGSSAALSDFQAGKEKLLSDLSGGAVIYRGTVQLLGVILKPEKVDLDIGTTIRQPVKADLEEPMPHFLGMTPDLNYPSAIMEIETRGTREHGADVQLLTQLAVALFRLFRVGGVKYIRCVMSNDSEIASGGAGTLTPGERPFALESYVLGVEDVGKLKKFWQVMSPSIPRDIYGFSRQMTPLTLAYDRYVDGLMQAGPIERRIANVIMGLEALYLNEDEKAELAYRLGLRIAKVMNDFNLTVFDTREVVRRGYEVRSRFAHGGHLDYKYLRKLEGYFGGDAKKLLMILLDYLRVSIIVYVLTQTEKEKFIDLIDDSFIDGKKTIELSSLLASAKALV